MCIGALPDVHLCPMCLMLMELEQALGSLGLESYRQLWATMWASLQPLLLSFWLEMGVACFFF